MRAAAKAEEASDKHPVTPGTSCHRGIAGEMLMASTAGAGVARVRAILEARPQPLSWNIRCRRAAEASGNVTVARDYYGKLQALTADRDTERQELAAARAFLKNR